VLAAMSTLHHRRREVAQLRRELHAARSAPQAQDAHPERQLL